MQNNAQTKARKLMAVAQAISQLSKDESTQVGALLIGDEGEGGPWGYNGAPRGCAADEDERFQQRPEKYMWAEHAERNAIYAAARTGFRTVGCTIYVTHPPCMDCARAIVQAGIKRVVTVRPPPAFIERWREHMSRSQRLFDECDVIYEELDEKSHCPEAGRGLIKYQQDAGKVVRPPDRDVQDGVEACTSPRFFV